MNRILLLLLVLILAGLAFYAGRLTAPPPQFQTGSGADLEAAFAEFQQAQRETLALMQSNPAFDDPQMQAEAYRGLLYAMVGSIKAGAFTDRDHPRFFRAVDWSAKSGLDNPDNNYYFSLIRDDREYLVRGNRGTTRNFIFQLIVGQPGVKGAGTSTNVSVLDANDMHFEADGSFEMIVGRNDPGPGKNWLQSGDGAETLLLRATFSDWQAEEKGYLTIEVRGEEGRVKPILTPEVMAGRMRDASVHMYDRTATWMRFAELARVARPTNGISAAQKTGGGLIGQWSAFGNWEFAEDEALILRSHPSTATYQGIELGNRWFVSLDYETRTSSLTLDQSEASSDGSYYYVISSEDPGIHNWLDTESHDSGLIMMRWQGLTDDLTEEQQPSAWKVPMAELRQHLPADTRYISPADRKRQIANRWLAVQKRDAG